MAYTPFLTQAGATIGRGLETRGLRQQQAVQNRLAGSAYMGDPRAMEELMQVNPQLGAKIQEQAQQRKAEAEQQQLQKRTALKKEVDELTENIAKFGSLEEAKVYADPIYADLLQRFPELAPKQAESGLTKEGYEQAKQIAGEGKFLTGKPNRKDFTQESWSKYEKTGKQSDLITTPSRQEAVIKPSERLAAGFALRTEQSSAVIDELGSLFTGVESRLGEHVFQGLKSEDRQQFEQAERNFTNAILRRESGAAIQESEFESAKQQYFPRPGDTDAVIKQKQQNRITVSKSLMLEAGEAFKQLKAIVPEMIKIDGKNYLVGTTLTNNKGQKGRLEQDGTITVLR